MTRVLVVEAAGNLWGSERALLDLLDGLRGMEIAVCCPPNTLLEPELVRRDIRTFPSYIYDLHNKPRWRRLMAAAGVWRACSAWKPDLIYLNQSGAYRTVLPAAWLFDLPVVAHVRIFEDIAYLARQSPRASRLRGLIAISHTVEDAIRAEPLLQDIACHTLYDAYACSAPSQEVPARGAELACVGRIFPVKGQDILVAALSLLAARGINPSCLMVGDGDQAYVNQLKASAPASVTWLGRVDKIVPLLRHCVFSICPSRMEPLGRVIFEAWDAGALPVACAQSGGAAEVIRASGGGLLYDENTAQSLADALAQALALPETLRNQMVDNGRQWLVRCCDPIQYGMAVADIFRSATPKGSR